MTSDGYSTQQGGRSLALIIGLAMFGSGLVASVVAGIFALPSSPVPIPAWVVFTFGHAVGAMGLAAATGALTSRQLQRDSHRADSGTHTRSGLRVTFTIDSVIPAMVLGCVALWLAAITLLKREALDSLTLFLGMIIAGVIGYWAISSYRSYRKRRR